MKFLAGLIAAAMTATLLAFAGVAPATAGHGGYAAHIDTRTDAYSRRNPISKGQRAPFAVRVRAEDGNQPNSTLRIIVKRRSNKRVVWSGTRRYWGGLETYRTGRLPRGRFKVIVIANTNWDRYSNSRTAFGQRVTR